MTTIAHPELEGLDRYKFGWADSDVAGAAARRGLNEDVVRDISNVKQEIISYRKVVKPGRSTLRAL